MNTTQIASSALFHAARVENSARLQRLVAFLRSRGQHGATSWELMTECDLCAPSTCISELRWQGYQIETSFEGQHNGRKVYRYRMI
jgi:hypothetical protein